MSNAKIVKTLKEMIKFYEEMHDFDLKMGLIRTCAFGVFSKCTSFEDWSDKLLKIDGRIDLFDFSDLDRIGRNNNSILNIFMNLLSCRHKEIDADETLSSKQWLQEAKDMLKYIEDELL